MRTQEVAVKITRQLGLRYGDILDQGVVRGMIEEVLYPYHIEDKETSLATRDNMSELILIFLATKKTEGLAKESLKLYGRVLGAFSNFLRKNAQDITTMDIRMYLAHRSKQGVKNTTMASDTDVIKVFFKWLQNEEYINSNPAIKVKTVKVETRLRESLTEEQFEMLRIGAKTLRQKALLEVLYSTGCRLDEVVQMKRQDIDWQRLQIKVIGKGNKQRVVYINPTCQVHLRRYLMSRLDDSEALFVTERKPIRKMNRRTIQDEVSKIKEQSGLNVNVYPHLLRHTFATHMLNSGMSLNTLQKILGHSDPSTTLVYAELDTSTVEHEFRKYS